MSQFSYEIKENIGVLSESETGWKKELKIISWNNHPEKFDIREWSPDGIKMGKGLTFTKEEISTLKEILNNLDF